MALESVNYVEDRAIQILQIVQDEEELQTKNPTCLSHDLTGFHECSSAQVTDAPDGVGVRAER